MSKSYLIRRLSWYYPTEGFNAITFTGLAVYTLLAMRPLALYIWLLYGLAGMVFILIQGTYYWYLKRQVLLNKPVNHQQALALFAQCKKWNQAGLLGSVGVLALQLWLGSTPLAWALGCCANGMFALEHINYYHRQLMIDNGADVQYVWRNRRLKNASLRKDLEQGRL